MGHDHGVVTAGGKHRGRLAIALAIAAAVFVLELVGAWVTGSIALLADAGHVFTDMFGVAFALLAATMAQRPPSYRRTFGWQRLEVIAAALNALLLIGVGLYVAYEAVLRLIDPKAVDAGLMLVVAVVGMLANFVSLRILTAGKDESINVRGAYLEVLGDLLGSAAVVAAAALIVAFGWDARRPGRQPGCGRADPAPVAAAAARRPADPHGGRPGGSGRVRGPHPPDAGAGGGRRPRRTRVDHHLRGDRH